MEEGNGRRIESETDLEALELVQVLGDGERNESVDKLDSPLSFL